MKNYFKQLLYINRNMSPLIKGFILIIGIYALLKFGIKLSDNPGILIEIPIFIFSIMLHEIAHGFAAYLSGDDTAKKLGRLSLNPVKHIDPLGLLLPLFLIISGSGFVIGWAKPVPVDYRKFKNGRVGEFIVSVAGIATNLILAFTGALLIKYLYPQIAELHAFKYVAYFISINLILAIFNLIPVPPLDGSKILASFAGKDMRVSIFTLERYGFLIILVLAWTGILNFFMSPIYSFLVRALDAFIAL